MRPTLSLALLALLAAPPAAAQTTWRLSAEIGRTSYSWAVRDTSADPVSLRPWHPSIWSLRLARDARRFGLAFTFGFAFGAEGGTVADFTILPGTDLNLAEFAPEVRYLLHRTTTGAELRVHAGPVADIWWPTAATARMRLGAQAGGEFSLPYSERWAVTLRGDAAITPTYVSKEEAGTELRRPSSMRRARIGIGVTRRM